ncbi:MAG TPA: di-trans,poly-cis-decaprenylcistransferase [Candidatus Moranbacteria bacterium]|nr:di-trans,poly-cis-decaprenylcistransferase [Candidatus Moranbacteria bacterium]
MLEEKNNLPNHIAIIPDGNRRWAKERGMEPWEGHEEGAKNTENLVRFALENGVNCITFWGSSLDNLTKRPLIEKKALLDIYGRYFKKLMEGKEIHEHETRINIIGRWEEQFPESLKNILKEGIEKTKNYKKKVLNFMLAYGGDDEMIRAVQKILDNCERGMSVTAETIKNNLMTKDLPKVDYLIRTGGEPHLSAGFMMWDTADSQLYFSEDMYPDFGPEKFKEALDEYARRQRRFGK